MPRRVLLPAAALLALLAAPSTASAAVAWGPCPEPEFQAFQCGTVQVPLDRSGSVGGSVSLFARRLTATNPNPNRIALVALSGGPGQSAAAAAADFAVALAPGVRDRDLLVFDQRGTGKSSPLSCSALEREGSAPEVVGGCAQQIGPARGFFRTSDSVDDLEVLRSEGGYDKLALFGVSYGTKVALDYASRYPARVDRLVLDSIVPQDGPDALVRSSVVAIRRLLRDLCGGGRCRRATPDPVGDVRRLVARGPRRLRGSYVDARGRRRTGALDGAGLYAIFQAGDTNPAWRAQMPAAMRQAVRGDEAALLRLASNVFDGGGSSFGGGHVPFQVRESGSNAALFFATICEEVRFPWAREASLQQRVNSADAALRGLPPSTVTPFDASTIAGAGLLSLCVGWPNAAPEPSPPGELPNVPALLLSGAADVRTPIEDLPPLVSRLPGAQSVVVPFVGHSVLGGDPSGCAKAAIAGFFNGPGATPCQNRGPIVDPVARSPRRLGSLPRTGGLPGRVGRTVTAVLRTRDDSLVQALALGLGGATRAGGLRGGTITVRDSGVTLRNVVVVDGVRVSGTFPTNGSLARLRVSGSAAARGSLAFTRNGRITGRLAGRAIRLVPRASSASSAAVRRGPSWDIPAETARLKPFEIR